MPDLFFLTAEENNLAELLGKLQHGDFAKILNKLSEAAKNEIRSAVGELIGEFEMKDFGVDTAS